MGEATLVDRREWIIMANARRICARQWKRSPNWVIAGEVFGLGSTSSYALCLRNGIEPEAHKIGRPKSDLVPSPEPAK